nr:hypothetical protein [Anaerolineae bacterium]
MNQAKYFIGTYLDPLTFLTEVNLENPKSAHKIIRTVAVNSDYRIHITAMGGLFLPIPDDLLGRRENDLGHLNLDYLNLQLDFEHNSCRLLNRLICELTLNGLISEAATPSRLCVGEIHNGHVSILYPSVSFKPSYNLAPFDSSRKNEEDELMWTSLNSSIEIIYKVANLDLATKLESVSLSLPAFIVTAYSSFSRYHLDTSLLNSWIACEQLIAHEWRKYRDEIENKNRLNRLKDTRTYTAAIQTEILLTAGIFSEDLADRLHKARKSRNDLAHNAENDYPSTKNAMEALRELLTWFLHEDISDYEVPSSPLWFFEKPLLNI